MASNTGADFTPETDLNNVNRSRGPEAKRSHRFQHFFKKMKESVRIIMAPDSRARESFISNPEIRGFDNSERRNRRTSKDTFVPFYKISILTERQVFLSTELVGQLTFVIELLAANC